VGRIAAIVTLILLATACQSDTHPVFSPLPSPTPHNAPTAAILQAGEVPGGLNVCLGSGPIDVYIAGLAHSDAALATRVGSEWEQLRLEGATSAAISVFTASPTACVAELGTASNVKSIASFVAVFADSGQADRAWESGIFGFTPPAPGELLAGVARGTGTGLGLSSWTYDRSPVRLGCWHKSVFVALVIAGNLDLTAFKTATAAVDARLD
jgi:hypothetical protein